MKINHALILSPHTDDAELGCGGTIAKFVEMGINVSVLAFSGGKAEVSEFKKSVGFLGAEMFLSDYETRNFAAERQRILEELIDSAKFFNADAIFVPCENDIHQDHQVITQEAIRAFKHSTIYGYELPWNNIQFNAKAFNCISEKHLQKKIDALAQYNSQKDKIYFRPDFIRSLARVRGTQSKNEFAEAFEIIRYYL